MQHCDLRESLLERTKTRLTVIKILITLWLFTFLIGISLAFYFYPDYQLLEQYISGSGGLIPETNTARYIFHITFFIQSILFFGLGYLLIVVKIGDNIFLGILFIIMSIGYICIAYPYNIDGYIHGFGAWLLYIILLLILGYLLYYTEDTQSILFYLFLAVFMIAFISVVCILIDELISNNTFVLAKFFQKVYLIFAYITITIFFLSGIFDKIIIMEQLPPSQRNRYLYEFDIDENCKTYRDLLELDL